MYINPVSIAASFFLLFLRVARAKEDSAIPVKNGTDSTSTTKTATGTTIGTSAGTASTMPGCRAKLLISKISSFLADNAWNEDIFAVVVDHDSSQFIPNFNTSHLKQ